MVALQAGAAAENPAAPERRTPVTRWPLNPQLRGQGWGGGINLQLTCKKSLQIKKNSTQHQKVTEWNLSKLLHPTVRLTKMHMPPSPHCHTPLLSLFHNVCQRTDVPTEHKPTLRPRCTHHAYLRPVQQNRWRYLCRFPAEIFARQHDRRESRKEATSGQQLSTVFHKTGTRVLWTDRAVSKSKRPAKMPHRLAGATHARSTKIDLPFCDPELPLTFPKLFQHTRRSVR